jgi:hypothetical protein
MPQWIVGYQVSVTDPGWADTLLMTDNANSDETTYVEADGSPRDGFANVCGLHRLGLSPPAVSGVYYAYYCSQGTGNVVIEYSADGTTWSQVGTGPVPIAAGWSSSNFGFPAKTYAYWRMSVRDNDTASLPTIARIGDFRLLDSSMHQIDPGSPPAAARRRARVYWG